jgi:hypothetical protein
MLIVGASGPVFAVETQSGLLGQETRLDCPFLGQEGGARSGFGQPDASQSRFLFD